MDKQLEERIDALHSLVLDKGARTGTEAAIGPGNSPVPLEFTVKAVSYAAPGVTLQNLVVTRDRLYFRAVRQGDERWQLHMSGLTPEMEQALDKLVQSYRS